jgi:selenocysteine-specific elongation factor
MHANNPALPGMPIEQLRRTLEPPIVAPVFIAALRKLCATADISIDRTWVRRPYHSVRFSRGEEEILAAIILELHTLPYRPPRVRDIASNLALDESTVRRLLRMASRRGDVDEIAQDHFFKRSAVKAMARVAVELGGTSADGKFSAADFRDRLDNGRKVAIQVLEFFDRHGLTMRRQDLRRINPNRVEFFLSAEDEAVENVEFSGISR